jgi:UDP-glucose 4-epimerase
MRVFVTGGTSFIGCHVVTRLLSRGHDVTILARDPGKVPGYAEMSGVTIIRGDLLDGGLVHAVLAGHDALVHIALGAGVTARERVANDTVTSVRLFEAAAVQGVGRIVHTSTVGVYDSRPGFYGDDDPPRPSHVYGATKAAVEAFAFAIADAYGVRANAIRPGYTFGAPVIDGAPMQSMPELPSIARSVASAAPVTVSRNSGLQFIAAEDLALVYAAVLEADDLNRRTFTALGRRFITWQTIAEWAREELHSESEIIVEDHGEQPAALTFDVSAIDREFDLAFDPEPALRDHLRYLGSRA